MENHILSETELNGAYAEIKSINDKISELDKRKSEISQMLTQSAINKAKSQFPGIEFGDKVKVVRSVYDFRNPKATETVIRYMGGYFLDPYAYGDYYDRDKYIKLELYQVKKDGTRSLKKDETHISNIVSIEKVEE
jgi:hypothetical protein